MTVNKVILLGLLGKDPEIRQTNSGAEVGSFSLATSEIWKDKNGEKQQKVEWHSIVCFGTLVKPLQFLEKGSQVYVEGKIVTEKYTDKQGVEKSVTKINASTIQIIKGKSKAPSEHERAKADGYQPQQEEQDDDMIPF